MSFEAAVVGAGPAGAAAAEVLARGGVRVVLIERERLPRYKTCGGGLVGRALREIGTDVPGLEREVRAAELVLASEGLHFRVERPAPVVALTMRASLDLGLLERAVRAGAELRDGCAVHGLEHQGGAVRLDTERGEVRAGCVVAADGALSTVARSAGFARPPDPSPALEWEVEVSDDVLRRFAGSARFDIGVPEGGYAWVFPKRAHLSVGILSTRRGPSGLRSELVAWLDHIGVAPRGKADEHGFLIPARPRPGPAARRGVLLVGDALGLADPVTLEGISGALISGRLSGEAILAAEGSPARAELLYGYALRRDLLREQRAARWLAAVLYGRPRVRRALFRRAGQALCEAMGAVVAGEASYRGLLTSPRAWWRLARG